MAGGSRLSSIGDNQKIYVSKGNVEEIARFIVHTLRDTVGRVGMSVSEAQEDVIYRLLSFAVEKQGMTAAEFRRQITDTVIGDLVRLKARGITHVNIVLEGDRINVRAALQV